MNRNDLLLLLNPSRRLPKLELLSGEIRLDKRKKSTDATVGLAISMVMYVVPLVDANIVFPFHRCLARVIASNQALRVDVSDIYMEPASGKQVNSSDYYRLAFRKESATHVSINAKESLIEATAAEIMIRGPGKIKLYGWSQINPELASGELKMEIQLTLVEAVSDLELKRTWFSSPRQTTESEGVWRFGTERDM